MADAVKKTAIDIIEHNTTMDLVARARRPRALKPKNTFHVQSIGCGEISQGRVRSSVKSLASGSVGRKGTLLASGTLNENNSTVNLSSSCTLTSRDVSYSVGSTVSADSFVVVDPVQHSYSEESNDPYLGRRCRKVKPEPEIPRYDRPVEDESLCGLMTACSEPETPHLSPGGTTSLLTASFPKSLRVPSKHNFTRDDASSASQVTMDAHEAEKFNMAKQEQAYWNSLVTSRSMTYGAVHRQTAEAMFNLGHAHMRLNDCEKSMGYFKSASRIWKSLDGPTHLSVGRALDAYGLAALRSVKTEKSLRQAKVALEEAFAIRFHTLGVWHVDTVETFNKIASVHLHLGDFREACRAYEEVYLVRKAIFGVEHPSVAISAHSLATVHTHLSQPEKALKFYDIAFDIYTNMKLSHDHPTVARLLRDRKRLEQVMDIPEKLYESERINL